MLKIIIVFCLTSCSWGNLKMDLQENDVDLTPYTIEYDAKNIGK